MAISERTHMRLDAAREAQKERPMACEHAYLERIAADDDGYCNLCMKAEIERLRARNKELNDALDSAEGSNERLRAELFRLFKMHGEQATADVLGIVDGPELDATSKMHIAVGDKIFGDGER